MSSYTAPRNVLSLLAEIWLTMAFKVHDTFLEAMKKVENNKDDNRSKFRKYNYYVKRVLENRLPRLAVEWVSAELNQREQKPQEKHLENSKRKN